MPPWVGREVTDDVRFYNFSLVDLPWSAFREAYLRGDAAPARAGQVFTFDARPLQSLDVREPAPARRIWDTMHLMTAMQGLANREAARFYVFYCDEFGVETDRFWFDWFRGDGDWLKSAEV